MLAACPRLVVFRPWTSSSSWAQDAHRLPTNASVPARESDGSATEKNRPTPTGCTFPVRRSRRASDDLGEKVSDGNRCGTGGAASAWGARCAGGVVETAASEREPELVRKTAVPAAATMAATSSPRRATPPPRLPFISGSWWCRSR
jgi:hypothetical protein